MNARYAELHPQMEVDQAALRAPAYARVGKDAVVLGNGFLESEFSITAEDLGQAVIHNKLFGEHHRLSFSPVEIWCNGAEMTVAEGKIGQTEARGSADMATVTTPVSLGWCDLEVSYVLARGEHFIRKRVVFHGVKKTTRVDRISLFAHALLPEYQALVHDGGLYFPILFLRQNHGGLFFCVDFPGYAVRLEGRSFRLDFDAGRTLDEGRGFWSLTAHLGVYGLAGRARVNPYHETAAPLDVGEQFWFREYMLLSPHPPVLPHLEVRAPSRGIAGPSELEVLNQCAWLDAKHVFMPRVMASWDAYPLADIVKARMQESGISAAVRLSPEMTRNLRWVALAPDGSAASPGMDACFACEEFCNFFVDQYVALMERHGFRDINITGGPIVACHSLGHGHAPGPESLKTAFRGLTDVIGALTDNYARVTCSRPYGSYGGGLGRRCNSVSILANEHPLPLPDLHIARQFADMGRLYFRRSLSFLLPRTKLPNSVGVVPESCPDAPYPGASHYPWYLYHDSIGWRYGLISAIATGLRHRFQALPQDLDEADRAFARKWLAWEKERLLQFKHVEEILDDPGLGNVDGYAYVTGRGALVFLFNCGYDAQEVRLKLRLVEDADPCVRAAEYLVREIYPREFNYLGPHEGLFHRDGLIPVVLEPKEARIIEVVRRSPATAKRKGIEVFGAEGAPDAKGVRVQAEPGARVRLGLRTKSGLVTHDVRFPGKPCPRRIAEWIYTERPYLEGCAGSLPQGSFSGKPCSPDAPAQRNVWLDAKVWIPQEIESHLDRSPFELNRPCWSYPNRLFFVVRFEPKPAFDPIRTSSGVHGVPEGYHSPMPMKCGIDLTPLHLGLKAWINGNPCAVYPALAAWVGFAPNPYPVTAYFFEAGCALRFGYRNHVVLFAERFDAASFRGISLEHVPRLQVEKVLDLP